MAHSSTSLPWVEKYRPSSMEDMAQQGSSLKTISTLIESGRLPHLLFYGPPGTGKTTAVQAIIRRLFGSLCESNVLELNASDERGIDVVRNQIKSFVSSRNMFRDSNCSLKIVILDEADAMTNAAQDALRRIIEKYVQHARFFIICNDIGKVSGAIQSRCMLFRFAPLLPEQMMHRLEHVIESEKLTVTSDGKTAILNLSAGDMRKVFNILQSASASFAIIDEAVVCKCCGVPNSSQICMLLEKLLNSDYFVSYSYLRDMIREKGYCTLDIIRTLSEILLGYDLPPLIFSHLIERLAYLEFSASSGIPECIQIANLVGSFQAARTLL
ncbi:Subunit of heteropentameric Replication factor C (RF-C) [Mitosporidium daphniae]